MDLTGCRHLGGCLGRGFRPCREGWLSSAAVLAFLFLLSMSGFADYVDANNMEYESLDYIRATGNQWIVTDITPTCTDRVKMKFRLTATGITQCLYCSRGTNYKETVTAFYLNNLVRCDRNTNTSTSGETSPTTSEDCVFEANYDTCRFYVNGTQQTATLEAGTYTPGSTLMLFASHRKGSSLSSDIAASDVDNKATYKLYYFELYASGSETPKNRLMPARRKSDSVAGLYDIVTGKFYGPASNSGSFTTYCSIKNIAAKQRYPWNGLVDLNFTITGDSGTKYDTSFTAKDMMGGTNITMKTIRKADGAAANMAKEQLLPGTYNWVWDAAADLPKDWSCDRVTITGIADVSAFPYSVKFNANGGTGTMSNESFAYGTAKALTANAFTRTGYTFQGWATSASGSKIYNDKQSVSNLTTTSGAVVNLYAVWKGKLYMVIDLSSGSSSSSYPVSYLDAVPSGGWGDAYKKTKLVLRRIDPGTFMMGSPSGENGRSSNENQHSVALTKTYYLGVFELTAKQYQLVMGSLTYRPNPDQSGYAWIGFNHGTDATGWEKYPMEDLKFYKIRGKTKGLATAISTSVDSDSLIGLLRTRTGIATIDLPTEAQWEYACRAGTTKALYTNVDIPHSDSATDATLTGIAVYYTAAGTSPVGTKNPNNWGLYDMYGNVWEWCLDWYTATLTGATDPLISNSSGNKVCRGGSYGSPKTSCRSACRMSVGKDSYRAPAESINRGTAGSLGMRLCVTLSE